MTNERETRYAEAILANFHGPDNLHSTWWLNTTEMGAAVMAVADAEIAAQVEAAVSVVRAERDAAREECGHEKAMRKHGNEELSVWIGLRAKERTRAESAESDLRALREGLEAIVADPDWANGHVSVVRLRALLAPSPAEGTGEAHEHRWSRRQNVTTKGYAMPPFEVCQQCDAARAVVAPSAEETTP